MQLDEPAADDAMHAALDAVLRTLRERARDDAALRAHLALLGQALLAMAREPVAPDAAASATSADEAEPAPPPAAPQPPPEPAPPASPPATPEELELLRRVWKGQHDETPEAVVVQPPAPRVRPLDDAALLGELSSCCAAKAERIRSALANSGQKFVALGTPCDFWMDGYLSKANITPEPWVLLERAYEAVADVTETFAEILDSSALKPYHEEGCALAAEVQSALGVAVSRIRQTPDASQKELFRWLREHLGTRQIYLKRFMTRTSPADPEAWSERFERIARWRQAIEKQVLQRRHEQKLFGKLRYQLARVQSGVGAEWPHALQTVDELVTSGTPPTNTALRKLLLPHRNELLTIDTPSHNLARVVRELERAKVTRAKTARGGHSVEREDPHVDKAAELLRGSTVVLVGGDERPVVADTIKLTFELKELVWCDTRPHKSHLPLETWIARDDVAVVLLAIRWASHGLGAVRDFCERYDKPFVRLPGGYNVAQLAYQILQQASERLVASRTSRAGVGAAPLP